MVAIALLALYSLAAVEGTCGNPDSVILSVIVVLPVVTFLVVRVRGLWRFLWILAPIAVFYLATPFGHGHGEMTRSPIFGIRMGTYCQQTSDAYYVLGGLFLTTLVVDVFFYFWWRRYRRWIPLTTLGMFLAGGAALVIANLSRHNEQYDLAAELARKYGYFSTGSERWNRPAAGGFRNDFQVAGEVVRDAATGLTWVRTGSSESLSFSELPGYINRINSSRFGGFDDWRIPSLAEAWTLLEQRQQNGLHVDPLFGSEQTWIWTSTIADDGYGWFVQFEWGRPYFQNAWGSHAYVRAVRGGPWK